MSFSFYKELNLYFEKKIKDDYLRKAFINKYFYNLTLNKFEISLIASLLL